MVKEKFTLRLDKDLLKEMKIQAVILDLPLNKLIEFAYIQYVEKNALNLNLRSEELK